MANLLIVTPHLSMIASNMRTALMPTYVNTSSLQWRPSGVTSRGRDWTEGGPMSDVQVTGAGARVRGPVQCNIGNGHMGNPPVDRHG